MEITHDLQNSFLILKLKGEFDINEIPLFEDTIKQIKDKSNKIVFDLTRLEYIDSGGIGAFIQLQTDISKREGGELYLFGVNDFIYGVLEVANLLTYFSILEEKEINKLISNQ